MIRGSVQGSRRFSAVLGLKKKKARIAGRSGERDARPAKKERFGGGEGERNFLTIYQISWRRKGDGKRTKLMKIKWQWESEGVKRESKCKGGGKGKLKMKLFP